MTTLAVPEVGQEAPDFKLKGPGGAFYTLSEYRGERPVVLVFYPLAFSPVCSHQLPDLQSHIHRFEAVGAQVFGISPQTVESHEAFSAKQGGFGFPLLADVDKVVGEAYGLIGPLGFYRRSAFVIDADGIIRYAHRAVAGLTYRPTAELVAAVRSCAR